MTQPISQLDATRHANKLLEREVAEYRIRSMIAERALDDLVELARTHKAAEVIEALLAYGAGRDPATQETTQDSGIAQGQLPVPHLCRSCLHLSIAANECHAGSEPVDLDGLLDPPCGEHSWQEA